MLEQLMVIHEAGVNNGDLQEDWNMFVDRRTGRAIMFDWNSYSPVGAPANDPTQSWDVAAPEAWLWDYNKLNAINVNIHAMDIWQAGMVWTNFIYAPCQWRRATVLTTNATKRIHQLFWRSLITTLGGNTTFSINGTTPVVDARTFAGIPLSMTFQRPNPSNFQPMLRYCTICSISEATIMVPTELQELATDLLLQMLHISPSDRPSARELLRHPMFEYYSKTTQS